MRIHKDDMVSRPHLDLVLQIHSNGGDFGIKLLPCNTLTFSASAVNCAVSQFFWLAGYTPLNKVRDAGEVVQGSGCSVVNDHFSSINTRVLLVCWQQKLGSRI